MIRFKETFRPIIQNTSFKIEDELVSVNLNWSFETEGVSFKKYAIKLDGEYFVPKGLFKKSKMNQITLSNLFLKDKITDNLENIDNFKECYAECFNNTSCLHIKIQNNSDCVYSAENCKTNETCISMNRK